MSGLQYKHSFKFVVMGSSGVGKTCILKRLIDDQFPVDESPTIGADYVSKVEEVDGQSVRLQIWDTAGQEKFRSIAKSYFRGALGAILVYDITDRASFDELGGWLGDVHQFCDPNAFVALVGNKRDLADRRAVPCAEARRFAADHGLTYLEASALGGENVAEAFRLAARTVYERAESGALLATAAAHAGIPPAAQPGGCC
jgi:small GTP-binding protein